jgi:hypothetical protein
VSVRVKTIVSLSFVIKVFVHRRLFDQAPL